MSDSEKLVRQDRGAAVYWFARLVTALANDDFILAGEANQHLRRLGFDVNPHPGRPGMGVDR